MDNGYYSVSHYGEMMGLEGGGILKMRREPMRKSDFLFFLEDAVILFDYDDATSELSAMRDYCKYPATHLPSFLVGFDLVLCAVCNQNQQ